MIKSVVAFIDGENLVMRFQDMVAAGRVPRAGVIHEKNRFLWHPGITLWTRMDLVRVNYYTSAVGPQEDVDALTQRIAATSFTCKGDLYLSGTARLLPHVHKKSAQSRKTKVVDIHLTVDAMRAATTMVTGGIFIASGDGDYDQLLAEIGRHGKQVYLAGFSSGLDERLKTRVEQFVDLDEIFFEPLPNTG